MKNVEILFALTVGCLIFMGHALAGQSHPANQITPGVTKTFGVGDYIFPNNLGIGTTPVYKLDINGALRLQPLQTSNAPTGSNGVIYYDYSSNKFKCYENEWKYCIGSGSGSSQWTLSGSNLFPNSYNTVNVGIGTNNPGTRRLKVVGDTEVTGNLYIGSSSIGSYSDASGGSIMLSSGGDNGYFYNNGQVVIGRGDGTQPVTIRGSGTTINNNLYVNGKTNIVNALTTWETWNPNGWDSTGETVDFTPALANQYSAMALMIAADKTSNVFRISLWTGSGGSGTKIGNNIQLSANGGIVHFVGGPSYGPAYTTFIVPTSVRSAKIEEVGADTATLETNPNIIITAYFR